jgi:hypothetical protein
MAFNAYAGPKHCWEAVKFHDAKPLAAVAAAQMGQWFSTIRKSPSFSSLNLGHVSFPGPDADIATPSQKGVFRSQSGFTLSVLSNCA